MTKTGAKVTKNRHIAKKKCAPPAAHLLPQVAPRLASGGPAWPHRPLSAVGPVAAASRLAAGSAEAELCRPLFSPPAPCSLEACLGVSLAALSAKPRNHSRGAFLHPLRATARKAPPTKTKHEAVVATPRTQYTIIYKTTIFCYLYITLKLSEFWSLYAMSYRAAK